MLKKKGVITLEATLVSFSVLLALMLVVGYMQRNLSWGRNFFEQDQQLKETVRIWKDEAELVVVGTILNRINKLDESQQDNIDDTVMYGFFEIKVEELERGSYPYDEIKVYFGWLSNSVTPQFYPPFLKKNYKQGDKIRVYLYFDSDNYGYYTPGAYYTMEPA
ncbi:MAG: hypothetical protein V1752_05855 [Candidatus Firestonebacteria bacterium]